MTDLFSMIRAVETVMPDRPLRFHAYKRPATGFSLSASKFGSIIRCSSYKGSVQPHMDHSVEATVYALPTESAFGEARLAGFGARRFPCMAFIAMNLAESI